MSDCNSTGGLFKRTSDLAVTYTGPSIPALGICTGVSLNTIEAIILQYILDFTTGKSINIPDIDLTSCALFSQYITDCNQCTELDCLMKIVFDSLCVLYGDFINIQTIVNNLLNGPYTIGCLQNLSPNATLNQIIQELITEFCALQAAFNTLQTTVGGIVTNLSTNVGNFLSAAISSCQGSSCVTKTGTGATIHIAFQGFTPIDGICMLAKYPTGRVDGTGLGLTNTDLCGWALCNGQNGTIDMRGYKPVGVNDGTMGSGSQNNEVNNTMFPGQNYAIGAHGGEIKHQLVTAEVPPSALVGTIPAFSGSATLWKGGRRHATTGDNTLTFQGTGFGDAGFTFNLPFSIPAQTISGTVGGGNGVHENRDPYRAVYFIQRIA